MCNCTALWDAPQMVRRLSRIPTEPSTEPPHRPPSAHKKIAPDLAESGAIDDAPLFSCSVEEL